MKPQDPPVPNRGPDAFIRTLDSAFEAQLRYRNSHLNAFDLGIRPTDLLRYASGEMDVGEHADLTALLSRSPWAVSRIAAIVKTRRSGVGIPEMPQDDIEGLKLLDTL